MRDVRYASILSVLLNWPRALADRISHRNRSKKVRLLGEHLTPTSSDLFLDVGFADEEYHEADNYLERSYPYPERIVALGIEGGTHFARRYPKVRVVTYRGGTFPFLDKSFDVCWSNAVVEHVGSRKDQVEFFREIARVAKRAFITTPNRAFPIEVHTLLPLVHWLPKRWCDHLLVLLGKPWATGGYMRLMTARELKRVLEQAGVHDYSLVSNRLCGITLDFVIIVGAQTAAHGPNG